MLEEKTMKICPTSPPPRKAMLEEQQARREGMVELSLIAEGSAPRRLFRPR